MILLKITAVFAAALAIAACSRRASAATRHAVLAAAQIVALAVPLLMFVMPPVRVAAPAVERVARIARPQPALPAPPVPRPGEPVRFDIRLLWLLGTLAITLSRTVSYIRAARIVRRARPFRDVLISDEVAQPVALGPYIVLPSAAETWDRERLRAVLLHERAHVARHDSLLAAVCEITTAVYWFHPLAWLTARRARLERERACDEAVLGGGVAPAVYAAAMLDVARALRNVRGLAMADRSQLETRVRAILDPAARRHATVTARAAVVVLAVAAAPMLAALTLRGIEPDLLGDAIASPFSERIVVDEIPDVPAAGPDAGLIAAMQAHALRPPDSEIDFVAYRARWALAQVRGGELVGPLVERLGDSDWRVRAYAAWGLAVARDARATGSLAQLLGENVWRVRAAAASALAEIADPAAAPAMRRALEDDAWQVRSEAVRYFAAIGAERALFERMIDDRHVAVRMEARKALE